MKQANGVKTMAEAYSACAENIIGWNKVRINTNNNTPQYFLT